MPVWASPKAILCASKLSQSNHACVRAKSLSKLWGSKLTVLHVLEDEAPSELSHNQQSTSWSGTHQDRRRVAAGDLLARAHEIADCELIVEDGDPAATILNVADTRGCDLIVTNVSKAQTTVGYSLGRTIDSLLRQTRVPVLIVRDPVQGEYRSVLVASDFSELSRPALEAAASFFPRQTLSVLHAYQLSQSTFVDDAVALDELCRGRAARQEAEFFHGLDFLWSDRPRPRVILEQGKPCQIVHRYVASGRADLVALGTRGRGAFAQAFLGSTAKEIITSLPCDALVVR